MRGRESRKAQLVPRLISFLSAAAFLSVGTLAPPAHAWVNPRKDVFSQLDQKTKAQVIKLADQAQERYDRGDYSGALELFTQAENIAPLPTVEIALAKTLIKLKRLADAAAMYEKAIAAEVNAETPGTLIEAVARAKDDLHELLPRVPAVEIIAKAGVSKVIVNGRPLSAQELSASVRLNPGPHTIEAEGADPVRISLKEGERRRVEIYPRPVKHPPDWKFVSGIAGISLSVITLGVGVGSTVRYVQLKNAFEPYREVDPYSRQTDICAFAGATQKDPMLTVDSTNITELCDGIGLFQTMQIVMYPLHLATAAAGIYLLVTSSYWEQPQKPRVQLLPQVSPQGAGLDFRVHF